MTHGSRFVRCALLAAAAAALALAPADGYAQQAGHNIPGDMGMMSGTQAPPGIYAGFAYYAYPTDKLKNNEGDTVNRRTGVGRTFVKPVAGKPIPMIANLSVAYYAQFKATEDSGADIRPRLRGLKDHVFGIGPDFNILIPHIGATFGVRYMPEFGARNTTQGQTIFVSLTFIVKPFPPPTEAQPAAAPAAPRSEAP